MPSDLGTLIRRARKEKNIGVRAFARLIAKSPSFVTQLESDEEIPSVAEETLRSIARHLELDLDSLLVLANRTPKDVIPESSLEVALYRKVKTLSATDQERVRHYLEQLFRGTETK